MTTGPIEVRAATLDDAAAIAELLRQLGYPNTRDEVRGRLGAMDTDAGDRAFVACAGEAVLGFAAVHLIPMIHHDGCVARITAFVVTESARGRGIGTALFAACEAYGAARAAERLEVTSGDQRTGAHAFYIRRGCAREGQRLTKRLDDRRRRL